MHLNSLRAFLFFVCSFVATLALAEPRVVPIAETALITGQSSLPRQLLRVGSQVFFVATDGKSGEEVWRTDGTAAGTRMVTSGVGTPSLSGAIGNAVVYTASDEEGRKVWRSDGTAAGTWSLGVIPPSPSGAPGYSITVVPADTRVFVVVQPEYSKPWELLVSDGTANSLTRIGTYDIVPTPTLGANGKLYFIASDAYVGAQFWVSDGTPDGTHMVRRGAECPTGCTLRPTNFFRIGASVFFTTEDGLWKTDGTSAGTVKIVTLVRPALAAAGSNTAYLWTDNFTRLRRTDGTGAGTTDAGPVQGFPQSQVLDDGRLVYSASGIWKSDGTAAGTVKVATVPSTSSTPSIVATIGSRVLVVGYDATTASELWSVDVDSGAAALVKDIDPRVIRMKVMSSQPGEGVTLGTNAIFPATDVSGREVWLSDGTEAGTKLLANIAADPAGGIVSGRVTEAGSNSAITNANVTLCTSTTACEEWTRTAADGTFSFHGVIPGSYFVKASGTAHVEQWYGAPSTITVVGGYETADVDFSLTRGGSISGKITRLTNGEAIQATVTVRRNGTVVTWANSSWYTGEYRVSGLATGTYTVEVRPQNVYDVPLLEQVYGGATCPVTGCSGVPGTSVAVTAGQDTPNINVALHSFGRISGVVRDASNTAVTIAGKHVNFTPPGQSSPAGSGSSNAAGTYVSEPLRPGQYYVSTTNYSDGYSAAVYPNKTCTTYSCDFTGATAVTVQMDTTLQNINLNLSQTAGRVTGIVRDSAGTVLANVSVHLRDGNGAYLSSHNGILSTTAEGRYNIWGIAAGTYYLFAHDELHPNVSCPGNPCSVAGATPIVITAGKTTVIDVRLRSRRTTFQGTIRDAAGTVPASYKSVSVQTASGQTLSPEYGTGYVDNYLGTYFLSVLTRETSFYLSASAEGYHRIVHRNVRADCSTSPCPIPAGATALGPGTHTVDFALPRFGTISGTVIDAVTGKPLESALVRFKPSSGGEALYARTDRDGRYIWSYAAGSYYVYIDPTMDYQGQTYPNADCDGMCVPANGTLLNVPDGTATTGIDFRLQPNRVFGKIAGRVVDEVTGAGIANIYVIAKEDGSASSPGAMTDAQGYYTIDASPGTYRVHASAARPYFTTVYGGGGGTAVTVTAPNTTGNIDIRMVRLRVTSISPAHGPYLGGTEVVVTGANFTSDATLKIGDRDAAIVSRSATQIIATTPHGTGAAHVTVSLAPDFWVTLAHAYTYTAVTFTDEPLVTGRTKLKAMHITELRDAVNALRAMAGLAAFNFTDPLLAGKPAKALHILELRTALDQARSALGKPALTYTNALTARSSRIQAIDINELRAGVN